MSNVNLIMEGLHESNQMGAFEDVRNRDFAAGPGMAADATRETLIEAAQHEQEIASSALRASAYFMGRAALMGA